MKRSGRSVLTGLSLLLFFGLVSGCSSAKQSTTNGQNNTTITVQTDDNGFPMAPYVKRKFEVDIVPSVSWNHETNSFGYPGTMIAGANNTTWLPLSVIEQALQGAGIQSSLDNETLNLTVPAAIGVNEVSASFATDPGVPTLTVVINGDSVGLIPWLKSGNLSDSYVQDNQLMKALSPVNIRIGWGANKQSADNPKTLYIGSPIYGLVTTVTSFADGNGSSTRSGLTMIHQGNNFIPYNYIINSLNNAKYGIQVTVLGDNFSGLEITVPPAISVDMNNLPGNDGPATNNPPPGEVPIEINHHVVAYAHQVVPKVGPSTAYLSSAEVMSAIKRIGIPMHWNNTDGTFTQWDITEGSSP